MKLKIKIGTYPQTRVGDEELIKKKLCEEHNIKLFSIPRECARDYYIVKDMLKGTLTK